MGELLLLCFLEVIILTINFSFGLKGLIQNVILIWKKCSGRLYIEWRELKKVGMTWV